MLKTDIIDASSSEFWDECYISKNTGWDLGYLTPVFKDWCDKLNKKHTILVPGAGKGYDPIYFASKGHKVTAIDFSAEAVKHMIKTSQENCIKINVVREDIFNLNNDYHSKFDFIIEYTFFCAINRNMRPDYIKIMSQLLKEEGELVGLFLPILKEENNGGPPFSVKIDKIIKDFSKYFTVKESLKHPLSIKSRAKNEHYIRFKKK